MKTLNKILRIVCIIPFILLSGCTQYIDRPVYINNCTIPVVEMVTENYVINSSCDYKQELLINSTDYKWDWNCYNDKVTINITYPLGSNYSLVTINDSVNRKVYNYNFFNITIKDFTTELNCNNLIINASKYGGEWIAECDSKTFKVLSN